MYSTMHPRDKDSLQDGDILVPAWAAYTDGRDHMYVLVKCPRCRRNHERPWLDRVGLWGCLRVREECGTPLVVQVLSSTPVFHSLQALMAWAEGLPSGSACSNSEAMRDSQPSKQDTTHGVRSEQRLPRRAGRRGDDGLRAPGHPDRAPAERPAHHG